MSERKIQLWVDIDGPEKGKYEYLAQYKETPLGWIIQYKDHDGFSVVLARRNENIHLIKKGEWTIKAKYSLEEETLLSVESLEGNLDFAINTTKMNYLENEVLWCYSLVGQPDEFHFRYRWENNDESN